MSFPKKFRALTGTLVLFACNSLHAENISIDNAWAHALPAIAVNGAAYLQIINSGVNDTLISAHSPAAEIVEVHTHIHENSLMKMRKLESLEIPAGESVTFEPGGLHLMLFGLTAPFLPDSKFSLTLQFAAAGKITTTVSVHKLATAD